MQLLLANDDLDRKYSVLVRSSCGWSQLRDLPAAVPEGREGVVHLGHEAAGQLARGFL